MRKLLVGGAILAGVALAALPGGRAFLRARESNPVLRGRELAERNGCMACHRPFAGHEIPNPGSRWSTVPAFQGGNLSMYAKDRGEVAEFIRSGAPRRWLDDPEIRRRIETQHLRMPAFADRLSEREIADLVAFACAEGEFDLPGDEAAQKGRELARDNGCTACHGVEGAGGIPNPGSLGGFVPGFAGKNFSELVRDEAEFREWVKTGTLARLERNPVVLAFWRHQKVKMPAFAQQLDDEDIGHLWAWVAAVRAAPAAPAK